MRWDVQGAEAATGKETSITIDAATAEAAEEQARYNGILVSQVRKSTGAKPKPAAVHAFDKPVPIPFGTPFAPASDCGALSYCAFCDAGA